MSHLRRDNAHIDELTVRELRIYQPLAAVLTGAFAVSADMPSLLVLDANGAARNVDMPAVATAGMEGKLWTIMNPAAGAFALTVRDALAATIVVIAQGKVATIAVVNGVWRVVGSVA